MSYIFDSWELLGSLKFNLRIILSPISGLNFFDADFKAPVLLAYIFLLLLIFEFSEAIAYS
jgi:hypothetical protein